MAIIRSRNMDNTVALIYRNEFNGIYNYVPPKSGDHGSSVSRFIHDSNKRESRTTIIVLH